MDNADIRALLRRMESRASEYHIDHGDSLLLSEAIGMIKGLWKSLDESPTEGVLHD